MKTEKVANICMSNKFAYLKQIRSHVSHKSRSIFILKNDINEKIAQPWNIFCNTAKNLQY
jgi:hypothetical protein